MGVDTAWSFRKADFGGLVSVSVWSVVVTTFTFEAFQTTVGLVVMT
jgi:hypothetical protein